MTAADTRRTYRLHYCPRAARMPRLMQWLWGWL